MALDEKFLPKHPHSIYQVIFSFAESGIITPRRICLTSFLFWYWFEILYLCFAWPRILNQLRTGTCISGSGNCFFSRKDDSLWFTYSESILRYFNRGQIISINEFIDLSQKLELIKFIMLWPQSHESWQPVGHGQWQHYHYDYWFVVIFINIFKR